MENYNSTRAAFDFLSKDAKRKQDNDMVGGGSSMAGGPGLGNMRYNNKMAPEGLIGQPDDKKKKSIVILSNKQVEKSKRDIVTTVPKKIGVRDLINVMKADARLMHKPLLY